MGEHRWCGYPAGRVRTGECGRRWSATAPGGGPGLLYRARTWRGGSGRKGIGWQDCRDLLAAAHAQLPGGRMILVWDGVNIHRQAEMAAFLQEHADGVSVVALPAYAPELNPAEGCGHRSSGPRWCTWLPAASTPSRSSYRGVATTV
ncbi:MULTISPECIES: transposase [Frankia]|uniref:Tc1-like transposase DDE domain-containing protein n=1 Tax=Frankia casuarinae (strain DSM 45818 / CECT 9043 / HFP020203 / CcI3) TaxID=106370 RepID=Q2J901_FRACC|nr:MULTISPECIES: transposase [Frankia]ABD12241.1 hypothetical protein Francci3_2883 [Frankia casuarinae]